MSPDNDRAKQANHNRAYILIAIVSIVALFGISSVFNVLDNSTRSWNPISGIIPPDSHNISRGRANEASEQEAQSADALPELAESGKDLGLLSSSALPAESAIEEKITRDFRASVDRLTESSQLAQKPSAASTGSREEIITQNKQAQPEVTLGLVSESSPAPAISATPDALRDSSADTTELAEDEAAELTETDRFDDDGMSSYLPPPAADAEPVPVPAKKERRQQNIPERFDANVSANTSTSSEITAVATTGSALVEQFLAEQNSLENLSFQAAEGYWENTYIPGDPLLRQLAVSLQGTDQQALAQSITPNWQPFDPPEHAALALYLSSDRAFIEQPSRLRIQLGLQASSRQGGQRSTLNLAVVLDLSQPMTDFSAIRALLFALQQAQQPGDRFSLIAATSTAELLVSPQQFRFGPLQLALKSLSDERRDKHSINQSGSSLTEALQLATRQVRQDDDPNAVLGSSLVLLVTPNSLANERDSLLPIVHRSAVDGIFLSIVGLNSNVADDAIQHLVLSGQGNRRRLTHPEQAKTLVDQELYASSRAVARAVRLRIRLADGVKLVDILGSRPLQEPEAQRVREAEQSIDQRMARNLGIKADRGEDEEGIQIVIPHFYAGDAHVILLDVVAERAGVIAEVSARYKDLVALGNGVSHAQLVLDDISQTPNPLQRNVLKNLLAFKLTEASRQAGRQLVAGNTRQSLQTLLRVRRLFSGMREHIAAWANDRELLHDEHLLDAYLQQLANQSFQPQQTAAALRYLAFRKLIPGREEAL